MFCRGKETRVSFFARLKCTPLCSGLGEIPDEVITIYSIKQAVEDGALVEVFKNRWKELSGGKPIVATAGLFENVSLAGLSEIWNEYVLWRTKVMPKLPEEEKMFSTEMNHLTVWVIEDAAAFTLMYPEDY